MLTSGQLELNNYVNTEAKYTRFAYSSRFGFTLERGRYGLKHAACDSMLLLSDNDNYWRGRRECEEVTVAENAIFCRWSPWYISAPGLSPAATGTFGYTTLPALDGYSPWRGALRY